MDKALMRLRSMGACLIEVGSARITPDTDVLFVTALYLILERGRNVQRDELAELIWPTASRRNANHSLRQTIYRLRGLGVPVESTRSAVRLPTELVEADCWHLTGHCSDERMDELCALAESVFLPGYQPSCSPAFTEWLELQRDAVKAAARQVLVRKIARAQRESDWTAAEHLARACLRIDPLNELAVIALAEALARYGSKVQALQVLDQYIGEVGAEPSSFTGLPASVLRRRIAERVSSGPSITTSDMPLFGRRQDVEFVDQVLQRACDGLGGTVLFWGEPGIGKTRLLSELCTAAGIRGLSITHTSVRWNDEHRPFAAFADLMPRLMELPGALGTSPESLSYLRRLTASTLDAIVPSREAHYHHALYLRLRSSLLDLLDAITSEVPLVITIDDCQWLDEASADVCAAVAELAERRRLLLVLASRQDGLGPRRVLPRQAVSQRILPLPDADSAEFVQHVVSAAGIRRPSEFPQWCARFGDGNPLLLLELALRAVERHGVLQPPPNLRAMLTSRVLHLPFYSRRLLEAITLLGRFATLERLEPLFNQRSPDMLSSLAILEEQGLVRPHADRVCVRHDLVAEVTLTNLMPGVRTAFHRRIASNLSEEALRTQSAELTWEAAQHWTGAGDSLSAIQILRACARHCLELGTPQRAIDLLREALACGPPVAVRSAVEAELAQALWISGLWEEVRSTAGTILQSRREAGPCHDTVELLYLHANFRAGRDLPETLAHLLMCVASEADPNHRVSAASAALMIADNTLDEAAAQAAYQGVDHLLLNENVDYASRFSTQLVYHTAFGTPPRAVEAATAWVVEARRHGPLDLFEALRLAGVAKVAAGLVTDGEADSECAYALAGQLGISFRCALANQLLWIALYRDDLERAEHWLRTARSQTPIPPVANQNLAINAAELAWRKGEAQRCLEELSLHESQLEAAPTLRRNLRLAAIKTLAGVLVRDAAAVADGVALIVPHQDVVRRFHDQDIVIAGLVAGAEALGLFEQAAKAVHDLALDSRGRVRPVSPTLVRVLRTSPLHRELGAHLARRHSRDLGDDLLKGDGPRRRGQAGSQAHA